MDSLFFLSNVTIEAPFLVNIVKKSCTPHFAVGFNTWRQTIINPDTFNDISGIFLILDGRAWLEEIGVSTRDALFNYLVADINIIKQFLTNQNQPPLFVAIPDVPLYKSNAVIDHSLEAYAAWKWREELEKLNIPLLDLPALAGKTGWNVFYSSSGWYAGKCPWSMSAQKQIGHEIIRIWSIWKKGRKKLLILDLDNTLWGGVIGEDGLNGITLGNEGNGLAFNDFQKQIKSLKETGTLLAIVSKNNMEDAIAPFNSHSYMALKEEDFVAIKANWKSKADNIIEIANELNLGLDSFVFIDDNPVERGMVKTLLPEVTVPDFPEHPALLPGFANEIARNYFTPFQITAEDLEKTHTYQAEGKRKAAAKNFGNVEDYLKSMEMVLNIDFVNPDNIPRIAQLTQKTNQFNLTTRRYTETDIAQFLNSHDTFLVKASLQDKYGDFGIIGLGIIKLENQKAIIDTFLMSCRAMGRGVETEILHAIENFLLKQHISLIEGEYLPTRKNSIVADFYKDHGYTINNSSLFHKILDNKNEFSHIIKVNYSL